MNSRPGGCRGSRPRRCAPGADALLAVECDYCHGTPTSARYVDYESAHGRNRGSITQENEYRDRQDYELATYLVPQQGAPDPQNRIVASAGWTSAYSRLRSVEIFNHRLRARTTGDIVPTVVCLECGAWHEPTENDEPRAGERAIGHQYSCSVATWNPEMDDRVVAGLPLRASARRRGRDSAQPSRGARRFLGGDVRASAAAGQAAGTRHRPARAGLLCAAMAG